jgi:hypothetical protein
VFLVHPQNGLNSLILNWCTGGCWFSPAQQTQCTKPSFAEAGAESQVRMKTTYRKKEDIKLVFSPETVLTRAVIIIFGEFFPHVKNKFENFTFSEFEEKYCSFWKSHQTLETTKLEKKSPEQGFWNCLTCAFIFFI